MIKVSVMYPNAEGVTFNHDYYKTTHMPLVKSKMGSALRYYTVDKGLAGGAADAPAFVAMGHLVVDSVEAFQAAFGPHAQEIMGDIPNYTNSSPVVVISEITVDRG